MLQLLVDEWFRNRFRLQRNGDIISMTRSDFVACGSWRRCSPSPRLNPIVFITLCRYGTDLTGGEFPGIEKATGTIVLGSGMLVSVS